MDADLLRMSGAIDARVYVWYPVPSIVGSYIHPVSYAMNYSEKHFTSPHGSTIKATYYIGSWIAADAAGTFDGSLAVQFGQWIAAKMSTQKWLRFRDRPVLAAFAPQFAENPLYSAAWADFMAQLPANVYLIALGLGATGTQLDNLGYEALARYGPNGASIAGAGQHSRSEQDTVDMSTWGPYLAGKDTWCSITLGADHRAQGGDPNGDSTSWADPPLITEGMAHYRACGRRLPKMIYAATELTEGWPNLIGSAQRPGLYTDMYRFARVPAGDPSLPTSYWDRVDTRQKHFTSIGTTAPSWSYGVTNNPVVGAFDSDEVTLSDSNARIQSVTFPESKRITFYARGSFLVGIDTTSPATAASGSVLFDSATGPIFDSGPLTEGDHYITIQGVDSNSKADVVFIEQNLRALP